MLFNIIKYFIKSCDEQDMEPGEMVLCWSRCLCESIISLSMDNVTPGTYNTYLHKNTTVTQLIATVPLPAHCLVLGTDNHHRPEENRSELPKHL